MNFLWIDDMKKGVMRLALRGLIVLSIAAGTGFLGYVIGRSYGPAPATVATAAPATCVPANANTREAMAKRNIVWRVWNGQGASLPESPERGIAAALGLMLAADAEVGSRNAGMSMFLQKSIAYFSAEEIRAIQEMMGSGTPAQIADALRRISAADGEAADLIRAVLADRARVERLTSNDLPIPLETLPDGSTP